MSADEPPFNIFDNGASSVSQAEVSENFPFLQTRNRNARSSCDAALVDNAENDDVVILKRTQNKKSTKRGQDARRLNTRISSASFQSSRLESRSRLHSNQSSLLTSQEPQPVHFSNCEFSYAAPDFQVIENDELNFNTHSCYDDVHDSDNDVSQEMATCSTGGPRILAVVSTRTATDQAPPSRKRGHSVAFVPQISEEVEASSSSPVRPVRPRRIEGPEKRRATASKVVPNIVKGRELDVVLAMWKRELDGVFESQRQMIKDQGKSVELLYKSRKLDVEALNHIEKYKREIEIAELTATRKTLLDEAEELQKRRENAQQCLRRLKIRSRRLEHSIRRSDALAAVSLKRSGSVGQKLASRLRRQSFYEITRDRWQRKCLLAFGACLAMTIENESSNSEANSSLPLGPFDKAMEELEATTPDQEQGIDDDAEDDDTIRFLCLQRRILKRHRILIEQMGEDIDNQIAFERRTKKLRDLNKTEIRKRHEVEFDAALRQNYPLALRKDLKKVLGDRLISKLNRVQYLTNTGSQKFRFAFLMRSLKIAHELETFAPSLRSSILTLIEKDASHEFNFDPELCKTDSLDVRIEKIQNKMSEIQVMKKEIANSTINSKLSVLSFEERKLRNRLRGLVRSRRKEMPSEVEIINSASSDDDDNTRDNDTAPKRKKLESQNQVTADNFVDLSSGSSTCSDTVNKKNQPPASTSNARREVKRTAATAKRTSSTSVTTNKIQQPPASTSNARQEGKKTAATAKRASSTSTGASKNKKTKLVPIRKRQDKETVVYVNCTSTTSSERNNVEQTQLAPPPAPETSEEGQIEALSSAISDQPPALENRSGDNLTMSPSSANANDKAQSITVLSSPSANPQKSARPPAFVEMVITQPDPMENVALPRTVVKISRPMTFDEESSKKSSTGNCQPALNVEGNRVNDECVPPTPAMDCPGNPSAVNPSQPNPNFLYILPRGDEGQVSNQFGLVLPNNIVATGPVVSVVQSLGSQPPPQAVSVACGNEYVTIISDDDDDDDEVFCIEDDDGRIGNKPDGKIEAAKKNKVGGHLSISSLSSLSDLDDGRIGNKPDGKIEVAKKNKIGDNLSIYSLSSRSDLNVIKEDEEVVCRSESESEDVEMVPSVDCNFPSGSNLRPVQQFLYDIGFELVRDRFCPKISAVNSSDPLTEESLRHLRGNDRFLLQCNVCDYRAISFDDLRYHRENVHWDGSGRFPGPLNQTPKLARFQTRFCHESDSWETLLFCSWCHDFNIWLPLGQSMPPLNFIHHVRNCSSLYFGLSLLKPSLTHRTFSVENESSLSSAWACEMCSSVFPNRRLAFCHMAFEHGASLDSAEFRCRVCQTSFATSEGFLNHVILRDEDQHSSLSAVAQRYACSFRLRCPLCPLTQPVLTLRSWPMHFLFYHSNHALRRIADCVCPFCYPIGRYFNRTLPSMFHLVEHLFTWHGFFVPCVGDFLKNYGENVDDDLSVETVYLKPDSFVHMFGLPAEHCIICGVRVVVHQMAKHLQRVHTKPLNIRLNRCDMELIRPISISLARAGSDESLGQLEETEMNSLGDVSIDEQRSLDEVGDELSPKHELHNGANTDQTVGDVNVEDSLNGVDVDRSVDNVNIEESCNDVGDDVTPSGPIIDEALNGELNGTFMDNVNIEESCNDVGDDVTPSGIINDEALNGELNGRSE